MKFKLKSVIVFYFSFFVSSLFCANNSLDTPSTTLQLKELSSKLRSKYLEMDSYLDTLLASLLMQQHTLAFGGSGGSKTQTARDVLQAMEGKLFSLQFSPATKQDQIIGALKGKKSIEEGINEYETKQSLLMHTFAILDEMDKATSDVLASALSVLNERKAMLGAEEIRGELQSALITSNMTLNELLDKFSATNERPTGMALLDRIAFKVLVVNSLSSPEMLDQLLLSEKFQEDLPRGINLRSLREEIDKIKVPPEVISLSTRLWFRLMADLRKQQDKEHKQAMNPSEDDLASLYPYTMSNQFSTRGAMLIPQILKVGKYLKELKREHPKSCEHLSLSEKDIKLAHLFMIMQGPGKIKTGTPEIPFAQPAGNLLELFRDIYKDDPRTLKMMDDLKFERESFVRAYLEVLKIYKDEMAAIGSEAFAQELISKGDPSTLTTKEVIGALNAIIQMETKITERRNLDKDLKNSVAEVARQKATRELMVLKERLHVTEDQKRTIEQEQKHKKKEEEEGRKRERIEVVVRVPQEKMKYVTENIITDSGQIYRVILEHDDPALGQEAVIDPQGRILTGFRGTKTWNEAMYDCKSLTLKSQPEFSCTLPDNAYWLDFGIGEMRSGGTVLSKGRGYNIQARLPSFKKTKETGIWSGSIKPNGECFVYSVDVMDGIFVDRPYKKATHESRCLCSKKNSMATLSDALDRRKYTDRI